MAGCGSSPPPAIAVSCATHALSTGLIQARVTVRNTTPTPSQAVVYGPALGQVRFVQPVMKTVDVVVWVGQSRQSYFGFVLPRVSPKTPAHILFRLVRPRKPASIVGSTSQTVRAADWSILDNADCVIGKG